MIVGLHAVGDAVRYAAPGSRRSSDGGDAVTFVSRHRKMLYAADRLCLVGSSASSALVCDLEAEFGEPFCRERVYAVNPSFVEGFPDAELLRTLPRPRLPGRPLSSADLASHRVVRLRHRPGLGDAVRAHPAYPMLSFLFGTTHEASAAVVAAVVDPRWYQHPTHPNRPSRWRRGLGLTSANAAAFLRGGGCRGRAAEMFYCRADGDSADELNRDACRAADGLYRFWLYAACPHPEAVFDPSASMDADAAGAFRDHVASTKVN